MGAVWIAVVALYVFAGLISPGMFHVDQVLNILQVSAFLGVLATGQTLALLVGGIDVSASRGSHDVKHRFDQRYGWALRNY